MRLAERLASGSLRGLDLRIYQGRRLATQLGERTEWKFDCMGGRIRIQRRGAVAPLELASPVTFESPSGFFHFQSRPYRDSLTVIARGSTCEAINETGLEEYLDGLVNAEFSAKWSEEAIAAQVIAARTYALHQIRKAKFNSSSRFDVDATIRDQVYDGSIKEDYRSSRSVDRTRGWILTAEDGSLKPVKAFYHSTCGGRTELPESVWGSRMAGFQNRVRCVFCGASPTFRWKADFSSQQITEALLRSAQAEGAPKRWNRRWKEILENGVLMNLTAIGRDSDGRAVEVRASVALGREHFEFPVAANTFRLWIGSTTVRSTAFSVKQEKSQFGARAWSIVGRGHGHGVGMCQWGAKAMGERGYKVGEILKFYYPDTGLAKAW